MYRRMYSYWHFYSGINEVSADLKMFIVAILHKLHFSYHRKYGDYAFCKLHNLTLIDAILHYELLLSVCVHFFYTKLWVHNWIDMKKAIPETELFSSLEYRPSTIPCGFPCAFLQLSQVTVACNAFGTADLLCQLWHSKVYASDFFGTFFSFCIKLFGQNVPYVFLISLSAMVRLDVAQL